MSYVQKFLPFNISSTICIRNNIVEIFMKITHNKKIFFLSFGQIMCKHYLSINKWKRPKENSLWGCVAGKWEVVIEFCSLVSELYIPTKHQREERKPTALGTPFWQKKQSFHCWIPWVFHLRSHKDRCHTGLGSYAGHRCTVWDWCTCVWAGSKVCVSFFKELPMLRLAAWGWIYRLDGRQY